VRPGAALFLKKAPGGGDQGVICPNSRRNSRGTGVNKIRAHRKMGAKPLFFGKFKLMGLALIRRGKRPATSPPGGRFFFFRFFSCQAGGDPPPLVAPRGSASAFGCLRACRSTGAADPPFSLFWLIRFRGPGPGRSRLTGCLRAGFEKSRFFFSRQCAPGLFTRRPGVRRGPLGREASRGRDARLSTGRGARGNSFFGRSGGKGGESSCRPKKGEGGST